MNWKTKAFMQKVISVLPFSYRINYYAQRLNSLGNHLPKNLLMDRVRIGQAHLNYHQQFSKIKLSEARFLEIGTGWYPIVPIVFFLSGANFIVSTDIRKLYTRSSINHTIRALLQLHKRQNLVHFIPCLKPERLAQLELVLAEKSLVMKLSLLKINTKSGDFSKLQLKEQSFDLVTSNNTFQFIPIEQIPVLSKEIKRIASKEAVISIAIDLTDEFSHSDPRIDSFNFLKYSARRWEWITCKHNRTNRLAYGRYTKIFETHFTQLDENSTEEHAHFALRLVENHP